MGNQQINSSSIESFVLSINEDEVQNIEESQLMSSLFNLYKIFQKNPNAYIDFKKSEEKQIVNANLVLSKEGENEGSSSSKITKAKKYQSILLNLLMKKFDNEISELEQVITVGEKWKTIAAGAKKMNLIPTQKHLQALSKAEKMLQTAIPPTEFQAKLLLEILAELKDNGKVY